MEQDFQISLFKGLFQGRRDVFAIRWEKSGKSGYMPAYQYDPYHYRVFKMNGGTFQNYPHKSYLPFTEYEIDKHLSGRHQIGVYPLLEDNTSHFIVADFDKQNWKEEAVCFLDYCNTKGIPAYLERSRSGNGGHVWIFFSNAYPAFKSRKVIITLLEESGVLSIFDKSSSFDRLFPNQNTLSGKGLGNLIALPFYKPAMQNGNSCFIKPETFEPYPNQWAFLNEIKRVEVEVLDSLYSFEEPVSTYNDRSKLVITLKQNVSIHRSKLPQPLIEFLKEELNFANSEFFVKKQSGRSTFGTDRYFKFVQEDNNTVSVPRGFIGKLLRFCRDNNIDYILDDQRNLKDKMEYVFSATLRSHQEKVIEAIARKDFGVIVSPPGSGKTVMGLKIIANKKQPALIVVHRKLLLEQWQERVQTFLGIPKKEIGIIGQGKSRIGKQITIATIQSLPKQMQHIQNAFGTILIDECHHIPAQTFRTTIEKINAYYLYGLTATPFRKGNDSKLISVFLGEKISEILSSEIENFKPAQIIIRTTNFYAPFNSKTDAFETLSKILIHDSQRNQLIVEDVKIELSKGKKIAIITERTEHIAILYHFLKQFCEIITLHGEDNQRSRKSKWATLQEGNFDVLLTTGQYFGEGSDLSKINALFLVYPFSFKGKLIQYIGRVQRSEINPTIYDYRDSKVDYLHKLFLKRNTYYRKITRQATLFDEPFELPTVNHSVNQNIIIEQKIKVNIEELDFRYCNIGFQYLDKKSNQQLEFEIENQQVRPEYEVLKPYFSRILKTKSIEIDIYAELENGVILSQLATSTQLESINKEVVDSVKFVFLHKSFIHQYLPSKENILTVSELPNNGNLYVEAEKVLEDLLKGEKYKHSRHIKFLASQHACSIMKLRFVLQPFSFVFLLVGESNYHLVLETLDTEEATYIWHIEKQKSSLIQAIKRIDQQLSIIREKGRQVYLETDPENFSRIVHDYYNEDKGYVSWKDSLEERLT